MSNTRLPRAFATATASGWGLYALAYGLSLWALARQPGFSPVEPLFVLAVMGGVFPMLALAVLRQREVVPPGPRAGTEAAAALAYLAAFAVLVLGIGFSAINLAWPDDPARSLIKVGMKLVTMVALPVAVLAAFGHRWRETLSLRLQGRRDALALLVIGAALLGFQAVFGRGLQTVAALHPSLATLAWTVPACLLWQCVEAGLGEEVLFRVFLQGRLAAWLKSDSAAIAVAALLFGLAHAPGLYLRGASLMEGADAHPSVLWSVAYSIAVISPAGLLFGVIWARTRSLALVVILHGLTDLLPNLAPFMQMLRASS